MRKHDLVGITFAGICAGAVNGLFGAGGGMLLVPILDRFTDLEEERVFPVSVAMIAPICLVSLFSGHFPSGAVWTEAFGYLLGSGIGGITAGLWGQKIRPKWLHRFLGGLILWGGVRYLC